MTTTVTSADGTPLACEAVGDGPPVVLVPGIFCTRHTLAPLAAALAEAGLRAATYDRRGRGDSGGAGPVPSPPDAVAREVDDLIAVMASLGDGVAAYGHSSGACLVARAAAGGAPISRLVLHEPPWSGDDVDGSLHLDRAVRAAVDEGRLGDAIRAFLGEMGMPPQAVAGAAADPAMLGVAPTMPYDLAATGAEGTIPADVLAAITVPTLVLAGTASPPFFAATSARVASLIPGARFDLIEGADHGAAPDLVASALLPFLF
jgi:pimeloyl-ACP methyl ester carboxylesterase